MMRKRRWRGLPCALVVRAIKPDWSSPPDGRCQEVVIAKTRDEVEEEEEGCSGNQSFVSKGSLNKSELIAPARQGKNVRWRVEISHHWSSRCKRGTIDNSRGGAPLPYKRNIY